MLGLLLETCTERGMIAAFEGETCLFQEHLPFGLQNSQMLLPELQKKIQENIIDIKRLSFIAIGVGPGSYTGIRIGATIAKTLAFVFETPLVGICTLDTFIPDNEGLFAVVIDAKIGGVYLQTASLKEGVFERISEPQAYSLEDAAKILESIPTIVTPNCEKIRPKLEKLFPQNRWNWQEKYPDAEHLFRLAQKRITEDKSLNNSELELLYMRKTQAEIEKEMKKSRECKP